MFGFHVGGRALSGFKTQLSNVWVGFRAKYIPIEKLTTKGVLSGKDVFTTSPSARASLQQFKAAYDPITQTYKVTHATPYRFSFLSKTKIKGGASEFGHEGLFVTPEHMTSVYFLKVQPGYSYSYHLSLLPKISKPSIIRFGLKDVSRVPGFARYSYKKFGDFVKGKTGQGNS